jgi:hypothetical protein
MGANLDRFLSRRSLGPPRGNDSRPRRNTVPCVESLESIISPNAGWAVPVAGSSEVRPDATMGRAAPKLANPREWANYATQQVDFLLKWIPEVTEIADLGQYRTYSIKLFESAMRDAGMPASSRYRGFILGQEVPNVGEHSVILTGILIAGKDYQAGKRFPFKLSATAGHLPQLTIWPAGTDPSVAYVPID